MNIDTIKEKLKELLDEQRFVHSLGTMEYAVLLAQKFGEDVQKAMIAGLVHDCAKCLEKEELLNYAFKSGIVIDNIMINQPELLHGPAGSYLAKQLFEIYDSEILNAIAYHTTGRENMTKLEKIIYVADLIEPSRKFKSVEILRKKSFEDLDKAVIMAMDNTIKYVIEKGGLIHPSTIFARNQLILKESGEDN
ncbi:bis(5'-nucleosyl)-tetraphosphatase (symmetrical) YqeK [Caldicellulosiruptor naganoensis]|uniref:bis(5'-nucleosyl)-tetraphosphatase (symmetrical) n=1 Tax=Caldicellulosiruptor naganoensis TaxID=29324 RepID=A0ABY7BE38_9FIRM|nr:bis(5'-nucleosyl)-tetraphosphatase (symmetrical) YqeK [Caldicellulosiruptor naganoensis]WAM30710.1 bis(5'-nucleosyl)-tetraphosphatase (symmetrical) YqeK [Caldicellulosiruptor naganoensis]